MRKKRGVGGKEVEIDGRVQKDFRVPWILQDSKGSVSNWHHGHCDSGSRIRSVGAFPLNSRSSRCNTLSGSGGFGSHIPDER